MESILVVDDESESLRLLSDMLAAEGYRVRVADSGNRALASAAAEVPDLVLAHVHMAGMDGFEFCRRLKEQKGTAAVPLIFFSGTMDREARVEALRLGAVDFVTKPFRTDELLARVRTHLGLGHQRSQLEAQVTRTTAELRAADLQLQREIAYRTEAEKALSESEERFRDMANTAPVLIWTSGPDAQVNFVNSNWLEFTGRTIEQELGSGWSEGVHPDDLDRCLAIYTSCFQVRRAFRMEYRLRRRDGEYRWIVDDGVPRIQVGGEFAGYIGSCVDVTHVRQAHQEALDRERVESLRVLAGGIAHDFTNLMGSILATTELAEAEIAEGLCAEEQIKTIKAAAVRAIEMARELMTYGERDQGRFDLLDVSEIVGGMVKILKNSISKDSVLKTDLSKNLPPVWANPTHIRQVFMNLIINAAEAIGDAGGTIHIRTSRVLSDQDSGTHPASIRRRSCYVRLEVSDTGSGITEEEQTRIFAPDFTTKGNGHGLGLALVQETVHSHGGSIKVASAPGRGTTFEILLPCAQFHVGIAAGKGYGTRG